MKKARGLVCLVALVLLACLLPATALAEGEYDLWVNGTQVTQQNAGDVLGNGTVAYNAATNTLTLNNAVINTAYTSDSYYTCGIYAKGNINIQLEGNNSITISGGMFPAGIHAEGVLTIGGSGSLQVSASGASVETRAISTGYTAGEAGVVINGGAVTVNASGAGATYAVYVDGSYGTTPPNRYFQINGGTVELNATSTALCMATSTKPDLSRYEGYSATAIFSGTEQLQAYSENSWSYYRYIKVQPLAYDENGISEDKQHYQPARQAADGYYEIQNAGNLFWFAQKLAENANNDTLNARLTGNITMPAGMNWVAMQAGPYGTPYNGTFDGNGYTISNLSVESDNTAGVFNNEGLFKTIGQSGVVKNLGMVNASVKSSAGYAGAICGTNNGRIENCYNLGGVIDADRLYGGGIVGINQGTVVRCYNTGSVLSSSGAPVGGIAGNNTGTISQCYNTGTVSSRGSWVGGITGYSENGEISDCYNTGNITGGYRVGGMCGEARNGTVKNCYNTGAVAAGSPSLAITANPIVGVRSDQPAVENTYYLSATETSDGGKTAAQLAGGEIAYLLNANRADAVWGQALGKQAAPVLGGAAVYKGYAFCYSAEMSYSNDASAVFAQRPQHRFTVLKHDGQNHWYACVTAGCPETYGLEAHKGGQATYSHGPLCAVCGAEYGSPKQNPQTGVAP